MKTLSRVCLPTLTKCLISTQCVQCVNIYSTGSKFCLISNFMWLHALTQHTLTQVTRFYVLL